MPPAEREDDAAADDARLPASRRAFLKTTGVAAAASALAGCSDLEKREFAAAPAGLGDPAAAGYSLSAHRTLTRTRSVSVGGKSIDATVRSELRAYRPGDDGRPWLGALSTPRVRLLGKSFNPVAEASFVELVSRYGDPVLSATSASDGGSVSWTSGPVVFDEFTGTLLGDAVTGKTLLGRAEGGSVVLLHLARTTDAGDVVVVAAVHTYAAPEGASGPAEAVLGRGDVPGEGEIATQADNFASVLPSIEHPVESARTETSSPTESTPEDPRAILTDVKHEPMGGGRDRITATFRRFEAGVGFVGKRVALEDLGFQRKLGERTPDWGEDPSSLVDVPPQSTNAGAEGTTSSLAAAIGATIAVFAQTMRAMGPGPGAGWAASSPFPPKVSLKSDQTPLKDQKGRGTCTSFAVCAALEAAYKRAGYGTLDLSEQYLNHLQKMVSLHHQPGKDEWSKQRDPKTGTLTHDGFENLLGTGGGAHVGYLLALLTRYGVPKSSDALVQHTSMPDPYYVADWDYENTSQKGDDPSFSWSDPASTAQEAVNDFNLQDEWDTWQISPRRRHVRLRPFPRDALWNARYGVHSYTYLHYWHRPLVISPGMCESFLAQAGKEVVVAYGTGWAHFAEPAPEREDFGWPKDHEGNSPPESYDAKAHKKAVEEWKRTDGDAYVYDPNGSDDAGHVVTLVGYDRTGNRPHFIAKNSWNTYSKLGYDLFEKGVVYEAGVVNVVEEPTFDSLANQDFLGRYDVTYDGGRGTLDVFRLPGFYAPEDLPPKNVTPSADRRIGSFTDENGNLYRVNGKVVHPLPDPGSLSNPGAELHFNVDFSTPNQAYDSTSGTTFVGYMHPDDRTLMAGTVRGPVTKGHRGFYATKDELGESQTRVQPVSMRSFLGEWEVTSVYHDVTNRFVVYDYDVGSRTFTGRMANYDRYHEDDFGDPVTGTKARFAETVTMQFGPDDVLKYSTPGTFTGNLHADTGAVVSGTYDTSVGTAPMVLTRVGDIEPSVVIIAPESQSTVHASKSSPVTLEALVLGKPGSSVRWYSQGMYEPDDKRVVLGTGNPFSASLPPGQYKITAEHTGGTATSFIYLYVLEGGTGAPRVRIFSPSDGATITSASGFDRHPYADVTLSGMAKAGNTKLTGSSLKWAVRVHGSGNAWTNAGTGATASVRLSDPRSGPTVYDVRLTATDSAGNSASDSVTVSVQL